MVFLIIINLDKKKIIFLININIIKKIKVVGTCWTLASK